MDSLQVKLQSDSLLMKKTKYLDSKSDYMLISWRKLLFFLRELVFFISCSSFHHRRYWVSLNHLAITFRHLKSKINILSIYLFNFLFCKIRNYFVLHFRFQIGKSKEPVFGLWLDMKNRHTHTKFTFRGPQKNRHLQFDV